MKKRVISNIGHRVCGMFSAMGLGVGGNLPVDGALFLEFLPFASGNLLTMLSVWWPVGQLIGRSVPLVRSQDVSGANIMQSLRMGLHPQFHLRLQLAVVLRRRVWRSLLPQARQHGLALPHLHPGRSHSANVRLPVLLVPPVRVSQVPALAGSPGRCRPDGACHCVQEQVQNVAHGRHPQ